MKKKRILKLADHMERVGDKNYAQNSWVGGELNQSTVELGKRLTGYRSDSCQIQRTRITIKEGACNTTMCVLGHAVGALPEAKLFFGASDYGIDRGEDGFEITEIDVLKIKDGVVLNAFEAGADALGISDDHARVIFGGLSYSKRFPSATDLFYGPNPTPQSVAAKLREYVATDGGNVQTVLDRRA